MKQRFTATLGCLILSCAMYAQTGTGWLPPVTFPANSNVCDASSWKLVFYDEFNGNTLSDKWRTAVTYDEDRVIRGTDTIIKGEHENQRGARYNETDGPCLYLKENIVVSNGTCKLMMKLSPNSSWTFIDSQKADYPSTTIQANLTSAIIKLPQERVDRTPIGYSSGRFEARIKHPIARGTWTAFWLWAGRGEINELDITESRGGETSLDRHTVDYATHAWWFQGNNPYNLPQEIGISKKYPNQEWYKWFWWTGGGYFQMQNWHTYTYEWDTASMTAYVDGNLAGKFWKYCRRVNFGPFYVYIGSGCNVDGTYYIPKGYAWNSNNSNCDVRFECKFKPGTEKYYSGSGIIDKMEIDYLKIWQRHPEQDNHTELCADNTYPAAPVISGPYEVCPIGAYTISSTVPGSQWDASNHFALSNTTGNTASLYKNAGSAFNGGWIAYKYGNGVEGCPFKSVARNNLYCNRSTDWQVVMPTVWNNNGVMSFHFISELYHKRDVSDGTTPVVTWNVSINREQDSYDEYTAENYTLYGQYASTPPMTAPGNGLFNIKWTMNVTDASGTRSRSGERNSKTALYQQRDDKNTYYLNAYIDDQDSYDTTVYYSVASNMVSEEEYNDTLYMNELVEKIRAAALEPYLITDGLESLMNKGASDFDKPGDEGGLPVAKSRMKVFPNPVRSNITIIADARFSDGQAITLHVYDLAGKLIKTSNLNYSKGNIMTYNLRDIADGNYILELQQGSINEHIKITKMKY